MPEQRVFIYSELPMKIMENIRGGQGQMEARVCISPANAAPDSPFSAFGVSDLLPGTSIGMHEHIDDEEVYVILSGEGIYIDNEGKRHPVKGGDVTLCRKGEKHGLENTGTEPLRMIGIVAK